MPAGKKPLRHFHFAQCLFRWIAVRLFETGMQGRSFSTTMSPTMIYIYGSQCGSRDCGRNAQKFRCAAQLTRNSAGNIQIHAFHFHYFLATTPNELFNRKQLPLLLPTTISLSLYVRVVWVRWWWLMPFVLHRNRLAHFEFMRIHFLFRLEAPTSRILIWLGVRCFDLIWTKMALVIFRRTCRSSSCYPIKFHVNSFSRHLPHSLYRLWV